jgi:hypothetical protein
MCKAMLKKGKGGKERGHNKEGGVRERGRKLGKKNRKSVSFNILTLFIMELLDGWKSFIFFYIKSKRLSLQRKVHFFSIKEKFTHLKILKDTRRIRRVGQKRKKIRAGSGDACRQSQH